MQEELFGPILAVMHVASFAAALAVAGSTEFALTGAVTLAYRVTLTRRANAFGWAIYISTVAVLGPWCSVTPLEGSA